MSNNANNLPPNKSSGPFVQFNATQLSLIDLFKESSKSLSKKEALAVLKSLASELGGDVVAAGQVRVSSIIASMSNQSLKDRSASKVNAPSSKANAPPRSRGDPQVPLKSKVASQKDPLWVSFLETEGKELSTARNDLKDTYGAKASAEQKAEIAHATAALRAAYGIFRDQRADPEAKAQEPAQTPKASA